MADKIVVMHDGIVEQMGTPLELYDTPANQFVAGFIGSPAMNFLKGKVKSNGSASFEGPNGVKLPLASAPANSEGQPAVYGVRPEHFTIADDGAEAEIVVVEPTGSETQVFAKLGGEQVVAVFRERHQFNPGDKIRLKPDPALVHLFDETTGKRLNAEMIIGKHLDFLASKIWMEFPAVAVYIHVGVAGRIRSLFGQRALRATLQIWKRLPTNSQGGIL